MGAPPGGTDDDAAEFARLEAEVRSLEAQQRRLDATAADGCRALTPEEAALRIQCVQRQRIARAELARRRAVLSAAGGGGGGDAPHSVVRGAVAAHADRLAALTLRQAQAEAQLRQHHQAESAAVIAGTAGGATAERRSLPGLDHWPRDASRASSGFATDDTGA